MFIPDTDDFDEEEIIIPNENVMNLLMETFPSKLFK